MENNRQNIDPIALLPRVFSGEAGPEERRMVEDWIAASSANRKEYGEFARLWDMTGNAIPTHEINIDSEWRRMEAVVFPVRSLRPMRYLQIAALIAVVSVLAFLAIRQGKVEQFRSSPLGTSEVVLPDGSRVTLNAETKLTFRKGFGKSHRRIILTGEAFFEVMGDAGLPFIVHAGSARIEVTGTRFNVRAYRKLNRISVTVTEGSVKLSETRNEIKTTPVRAGETGWYDVRSHRITHSEIQNPNDLSWKTGILNFRNTPLAEVAELLSNTYHRPFAIDPALKDCTVTVRFENRTLDEVLSVLKSTLGLEISEEGNQITLKGPGC